MKPDRELKARVPVGRASQTQKPWARRLRIGVSHHLKPQCNLLSIKILIILVLALREGELRQGE